MARPLPLLVPAGCRVSRVRSGQSESWRKTRSSDIARRPRATSPPSRARAVERENRRVAAQAAAQVGNLRRAIRPQGERPRQRHGAERTKSSSAPSSMKPSQENRHSARGSPRRCRGRCSSRPARRRCRPAARRRAPPTAWRDRASRRSGGEMQELAGGERYHVPSSSIARSAARERAVSCFDSGRSVPSRSRAICLDHLHGGRGLAATVLVHTVLADRALADTP